jgi:L-aspartate oxidase
MNFGDESAGPERQIDVRRGTTHEVDVLVIGGGVAGFRAAIEAAKTARVLVVTKDSLRESNSDYAQGGVAAVLSDDDSLEAHRDDTLRVGDGLCDVPAVNLVVAEGPERIRELVEWGGEFDRSDGRLDLTLEGGHSKRRVVHARGDATGAEVQKTLVRRVKESPNITAWEYAFAVDLLVDEDGCRGAAVYKDRRELVLVRAKAVILATGGSGRLYRETTNPEIATGDGLAMAWRAGATLRDLEFVQFHPTTLYVAGSGRHLISEAVRGEGAHLVDERGDRFTFHYHPAGELAPRDVVSRAITAHLAATKGSCVYLDLRHLGPHVATRFPGITKVCALFNLDILRDRIPVMPSAHYHVGGVACDLFGRTDVAGLYVAGEVSSSGLHGANRLASNSLLEGLVFGRLAGEHAATAPERSRRAADFAPPAKTLPGSVIHVPDMVNSIRSLMWKTAGITRRGDGLAAALATLDAWDAYVRHCDFADPRGFELVNLLTVARLVVRGAHWREESRGAHFRSDFPQGTAEFRAHSLQRKGSAPRAQPVVE